MLLQLRNLYGWLFKLWWSKVGIWNLIKAGYERIRHNLAVEYWVIMLKGTTVNAQLLPWKALIQQIQQIHISLKNWKPTRSIVQPWLARETYRIRLKEKVYNFVRKTMKTLVCENVRNHRWRTKSLTVEVYYESIVVKNIKASSKILLQENKMHKM